MIIKQTETQLNAYGAVSKLIQRQHFIVINAEDLEYKSCRWSNLAALSVPDILTSWDIRPGGYDAAHDDVIKWKHFHRY